MELEPFPQTIPNQNATPKQSQNSTIATFFSGRFDPHVCIASDLSLSDLKTVNLKIVGIMGHESMMVHDDGQ